MIIAIFLLTHLVQGCLQCYEEQNCKTFPKPINLHISVHPHLDAYRIYNFSTYYNPSSIEKNYFKSNRFTGVKQILDTAFSILKESASLREISPNLQAAHRTFMSSEMGFFKKWYLQHPKKDEIKKLIHSGYWEILGGGLIEQDQACAYIDDIIENYQLGLNFLKTELNYIPKVAISDSFGHSQSIAALLSHLGIEGLLLQRSDQHILTVNKTEFLWKAISANGQFYGAIPTHIRWAIHGFQDQFIEESTLPGCENKADYFSLLQQQNVFLRKILNTSSHIIRYFGHDFQQFSDYSYRVIQAMMGQYSKNKCQSILGLYSTPTDYFKEIAPTLKKQRHGDIFPIWDYDSALYWTGYFTTDPLHKLKFRNTGRILQALRNIHMPSFAQQPNSLENIRIHALLSELAEEVAYLQHHNGVTGTSKYNIMDELEVTSINAVRKAKEIILNHAFQTEFPLHTNNPIFHCQLDAPCIIPQALSGFIYLKIINSGSIKRNHTLSITLPFDKYYIPAEPVQYQINCFCVEKNCPCKLYIYSDLHRYAAYILKPTETPLKTHYLKQFQNSKQFTANSTHLNIIFKENMYSISYKQVDSSVTSKRTYDHLDRYGNIRPTVSTIQSGKYALGNNPKTVKDISTIRSITMMNTTRKIFIHIAWKKTKMSTLFEIDKKIPKQFKITTISACTSKSDYYLEVATPIKSNIFYTDSNGWLVMKRIPFQREDFTPFFPSDGTDNINGNTYPITTFAYIETQQDGTDNIYNKVSVNVDRPQGVTLQKQGTLWLNFDRVAADDKKQVEEEAYRGEYQSFTHTITVQNTNNNERVIQKRYDQTTFTQGNLLTPTTRIANLNEGQSTHNKAQQIRQSEYLKININTKSDSTVLIRLLNLDDSSSLVVNLFATNESPLLSRLYGKRIGMETIKQVNVGSNMDYPEFLMNKWNNKLNKENSIFQKVFSENITLRPLQIRCFVLSRVTVSQTTTPYRYNNIKVDYKLDRMKPPPKRVPRKEQTILIDYLLNEQKCDSPSPILGSREMPKGTTKIYKKIPVKQTQTHQPSHPARKQEMSQDISSESISLRERMQNLQVLTKSEKLRYFTSRLKELREKSH